MKKNKKVFSALVLIFSLPFLCAYFLYLNRDRLHYQTNNHGEFLKPPIVIHELKTPENKPLWQMLYVINHDCDEVCGKNLYKMRQIRLALNKDQNKARGIIFVQNEVTHPQLNQYLKSDYAMIQLMVQIDGAHLTENQLYLADPSGNVILAYPAAADPKNILKDLKHLIKVNAS